jgi:hypothetical protein
MTIESERFVVPATPVLLSVVDTTGGCTLWIRNTHTTVEIQVGSSAQCTANEGHLIPPGTSLDNFYVPRDEDLYVARVGATNGSASVMRMGVVMAQ